MLSVSTGRPRIVTLCAGMTYSPTLLQLICHVSVDAWRIVLFSIIVCCPKAGAEVVGSSPSGSFNSGAPSGVPFSIVMVYVVNAPGRISAGSRDAVTVGVGGAHRTPSGTHSAQTINATMSHPRELRCEEGTDAMSLAVC